MLTGLLAASAFGKSSPVFLKLSGLITDDSAIQVFLNTLEAPAIGLLIASLGSSVACLVYASEKNRSPVVWSVKGLLGGPLALRSLRESGSLQKQSQRSRALQPDD